MGPGCRVNRLLRQIPAVDRCAVWCRHGAQATFQVPDTSGPKRWPGDDYTPFTLSHGQLATLLSSLSLLATVVRLETVACRRESRRLSCSTDLARPSREGAGIHRRVRREKSENGDGRVAGDARGQPVHRQAGKPAGCGRSSVAPPVHQLPSPDRGTVWPCATTLTTIGCGTTSSCSWKGAPPKIPPSRLPAPLAASPTHACLDPTPPGQPPRGYAA